MADSNRKKVVVCAGDLELNFQVGIAEFTAYQNEFMPNNKVAPSENFLMTCVHNDQREQLIELCDQGFSIDLAQMVAGEFRPEVKLSLKK